MTIAQMFAMNDSLDFMVFSIGSIGGPVVEIAKDGRAAIYSQNYPFNDPSFMLSRDDSKLLRLVADWLESYDEEEAWEEPQEPELSAADEDLDVIEGRSDEVRLVEPEDGVTPVADGPIPVFNEPAEQQQLLT